MKKNLFFLFVLLSGFALGFADTVISPEQLPEEIKDFVAKTFPGKTIQFVKSDFNEYELYLDDGSELDFNGKGGWKEIKSVNGVPSGLLPKDAVAFLEKTYPEEKIISIEKDWKSLEVKLSNRMEVYFNEKGKLLGQKFDD